MSTRRKELSMKNRNRNKSFDAKFANSTYRDCVSSPRSYHRRKQSKPSNVVVDMEQVMKQNIQECKNKLAEYEDRLQSQTQEILVNIPVFRAVKNLFERDAERKLRTSLMKWRTIMHHYRKVERDLLLAKKATRSTTHDVIKNCISIALSNIVSEKKARMVAQFAREEEEARLRAFKVQKWKTNKMTTLEGGSADGRKSYFTLPAPRISKYKAKSRRGMMLHQIEER